MKTCLWKKLRESGQKIGPVTGVSHNPVIKLGIRLPGKK